MPRKAAFWVGGIEEDGNTTAYTHTPATVKYSTESRRMLSFSPFTMLQETFTTTTTTFTTTTLLLLL